MDRKDGFTLKTKERAFIIFTDIDETFAPIGLSGLRSFVNLVKEIQQKENVVVKFCPISGRQADYVKAVINSVNAVFREEGIHNFSEFGAGEQGALLVNIKQPHYFEFLGKEEDLKTAKTVGKFIENSYYMQFLQEGPHNECLHVYYLRDKIKKFVTPHLRDDIFADIRDFLHQKFGDKIYISHVIDNIEVLPASLGKDTAIKRIFNEYQKKYNIVGLSYSGDSENDLRAVKYVSRLSEISGIKAHVILPSNAYPILESKANEIWKEKLKHVGSVQRIVKSNEPRFQGVMKVLQQKLEEKDLIDTGCVLKRSADDSFITKLYQKKITRSCNSPFLHKM